MGEIMKRTEEIRVETEEMYSIFNTIFFLRDDFGFSRRSAPNYRLSVNSVSLKRYWTNA